jgi:superfamily II DNA or RNA helicase
MISELRPYQLQALDDIRASVRGGVRRLVVQAATGAGKTKLAAAIVEGCREKGNRVAFVCPAIDLIDQTVESFYAEGVRGMGVIQASHTMTDWSQPVQICSIQTIQARGAFPEAKTVMFDECHRLHEAHKKWLAHPDWQTVPFIGLSATPWTRGLGKYFDSLLIAATTADLIEQGYLSKFRVFATGHPDLSGVKTVAGDYHEGELSNAMQEGALTADIIRTWQEKWGKPKTLCFGVDKAHAKSIQERFIHAGINCGYQDAETTQDERKDIKRKFHNGEYPVVSNIQTLTTGVDWDVRCLILARPTRSEMLFVQIIGRALRTAEGKDEALILDHSDTTQRLGFVTDITHEHLDDGKPKPKKAAEEKKKPLPRECEQCAALLPRGTKICPNCQHQITITSSIMEQDGELVELTPGKKSKAKSRHEFTEPEQRQFFAELKAHAIMKGYKTGWAANQYREKFKSWPPRYFDNVEPAKVLSPTVALWIRSRQIAFAMAKKNAEKENA